MEENVSKPKFGLDRYTELVWRPFYDEIFSYKKDLSILDAGCGDARYTAQLIANNDYHGVDIKETPYTTVVSDIKKIPYADGAFDEVIALGLLDYADPDETLKELNRVLKKDGLLTIMVPNKDNPYHIFNEAVKPNIKRRYTKDEIIDIVESHGFEVQSCIVMGFSFYVPTKWLQEKFIPLWQAVEARLGWKYGMNIYIDAIKKKTMTI